MGTVIPEVAMMSEGKQVYGDVSWLNLIGNAVLVFNEPFDPSGRKGSVD